MKIAYVIDDDISQETGVIKKIRSKIRFWRAAGHDVRIYSLRSDNNKSVIDEGIIVYKSNIDSGLLNKIFRQFKLSYALDQSLLEFNPDLIYSRYLKYYPRLTSVFKKYAPYIVEINSNDTEEIKLYSKASHIYNILTRPIFLKNASGYVSVSNELINNQNFSKFNKPAIVIGNGYDFESVRLKKNVFNKNLKFIFIGSPGQEWHGLDKIVQLANILLENEFHIIGPAIDNLSHFNLNITDNIFFHGYLNQDKLERIASECDIGFSSLAMHRLNLNEASSLKSRQYLAQGLPIILGYEDTDLPDDCEFILNIGNYENNVQDHKDEIIDFMNRVKEMKPDKVMSTSKTYLDQKIKEVKRLKFIEEVLMKYGSRKCI